MPSNRLQKLLLILFVVCYIAVSVVHAQQAIIDLLISKEPIVHELANKTIELYKRRCNYNCDCSYTACRSDLTSIASCDITRGNASAQNGVGCCPNQRLVTFNASAIRVFGGVDQLSTNTDLKVEECWSQGLDSVYQKYQNDATITWQYLGTKEGILRGYPGNSRSECTNYDPRTRPWYVGAASGPKDVVIVVDVSGSMSTIIDSLGISRIALAQRAAKAVLDTLTVADYVQLVAFDSAANIPAAFGDNRPADVLRPATAANILILKNTIDSLYPNSGTNYISAFTRAFNVLNQTLAYESTSGCQPVILFLTDGDPNQDASGRPNEADHVNLIKSLNNRNAIIFSYTVGSLSKFIPKAISCAANGVWADLSDPTNLVGQMTNYFQYIAALKDPVISYVEPYLDTSGAGYLTSASLAVFDELTNPPQLIGVISVSYQMSVLETQSSSPISLDILIASLSARSKVCKTKNFTECQLEQLRSLTVGDYAVCDSIFYADNCTQPELPAKCSTTPYLKPFCNDQKSSYNYLKNSCCPGCQSTAPPSNVVGIAVGVSVGICAVLIIIIIFIFNSSSSAGASTGIKSRPSTSGNSNNVSHADIDDKSW